MIRRKTVSVLKALAKAHTFRERAAALSWQDWADLAATPIALVVYAASLVLYVPFFLGVALIWVAAHGIDAGPRLLKNARTVARLLLRGMDENERRFWGKTR